MSNVEQQIVYINKLNSNDKSLVMNKSYKILDVEQEYIVHPTAFGLLPISKASVHSSFSCDYHIEDYRLMLDRLTLLSEDASTPSEKKTESNEKQYEFSGCTVSYNGVILIGAKQVKEYYIKSGQLACFSFQYVYELVFEDGILITTIDQSKAMLRIRKNLELGLRNLNKSRDLGCIKRFMNTSFVGDYKSFKLTINRLKYLKDMKNDYKNTNYINK